MATFLTVYLAPIQVVTVLECRHESTIFVYRLPRSVNRVNAFSCFQHNNTRIISHLKDRRAVNISNPVNPLSSTVNPPNDLLYRTAILPCQAVVIQIRKHSLNSMSETLQCKYQYRYHYRQKDAMKGAATLQRESEGRNRKPR